MLKDTLVVLASILILVHSQPLIFERAITGPGLTVWDGDLGVPFWFGDQLYFLEGDVLHQNYGRIPNAIGWCFNESNCNVDWNNFQRQPYPYPFYYLLGQSTVPAGAITINGVAYIFMMNMLDWNSNQAESLGIQGIPPTPFAATGIKFGTNSKFVNIAPCLSADGSTVYLYGSGTYRRGPISLAKVAPQDIGNMNALQYYTGPGNAFSSNYNNANVLIEGSVGEISAMYSTYLKKYLVSYFDFSGPVALLRLAMSANPWGPFDTNTILFNSNIHYSWMQNGWGGPYGGYVIPDRGINTNWLYVTLSLWVPYRVFILKVDLSDPMFTVVSVSDSKMNETIIN